MQKHLTIGEVSKRTGLSHSTIRYYEDEKLVYPMRNLGGHRRYKNSDLRRLSFIMIAQQLGFNLKTIRKQLEKLPNNRTPNKKDWAKISRSFKSTLNYRIKMMTRLRNRLDKCIGCGCLSLTDCEIYNPQDRANELGSGPRFLMEENTIIDKSK